MAAFRFVCMAWSAPASEAAHSREMLRAEAAARQLAAALQTRNTWHPVLHRPGLCVFALAGFDGPNIALPVADQGVVLGTLFRHGDAAHAPCQVGSLTTAESTRILADEGRSLVRDFWGRYVAILWSQVPNAGTPKQPCILRDPRGGLPCYLLRHENLWLACSWIEDVLALLPASATPEVNWDAVSARILLGELGGRETALSGVMQVLPGERVTLNAGAATSELLWSPLEVARSPINAPIHELAPLLKDAVRQCVGAWSTCYTDLLLRLSGGVDSSILAACLGSGRTTARVVCVNYHSEGSDSDERGYARSVASLARLELLERERDTTFQLERVLQLALTPTPTSSVGRIGAASDAALAAQRGATALFTGGGGDQLFFEMATWWPAADYLMLQGVDSGFLAAAMDAARLGRISLWRTLANVLRQRMRPIGAWDADGGPRPLTGTAAIPLASERSRFIHPALLQAEGVPIGKLTQARHLMHTVPYYDPSNIDTAPETVHPLMSQPLVELCLRIPTFLLANGGRGRALARHAFASDLPPEVAWRRSKGGNEEHIKAVLLNNISFVRELLLDGELVRRQLLDRPKLEDVLSGKPTTLLSHVGEVYTFIGIEAWLARAAAAPHAVSL